MSKLSLAEYLGLDEQPIMINKENAVKHGLLNSIVYETIKEENTTSVSKIQKVLSFAHRSTILRSINYLLENGLIQKNEETPEQIKENIIKGEYEKKYVCEWCGEAVTILQEHHFPVPQEKGGAEVVNICPNCHYTYHHIKKSYKI